MSPMEPDDLPERIVRDPSHPPRAVAFSGFLGRSHNEGFVRLYLDGEMREWFDIAENDILHVSRYEEGSTVVWVDQRTTLERRVPQPEDLEGEYLEGEVAAVTVKQSAMSVALDYSAERRTPAKTPPWTHK